MVTAALRRPTVARAVARVCATNGAALVDTCLRVVEADGALKGYRWGEDRKRSLLDLEQAESAEADAT